MSSSPSFTSGHFDLQTLAGGVHAAIPKDGGGAICNAGIIDLGGLVVVFDTFLTPSAAQDLKSAVLELTGRPADIVINSHYHNDHIWGNQVFVPEAVILSTTVTRQLMGTEGQAEYEYYAANAAKKEEWAREKLASAADATQREEASLWVGYYQWLAADMPTLKLPKPQITLDGDGEIHGTSRMVRLLQFEDGHTGSDLALYLPEERILFASDLLFVKMHPYLGECQPDMLLSALNALQQLGAEIFVPGHGPVGTETDLLAMTAYTQNCLDAALRLVEAGKGWENLEEKLEIPERYRSWPFGRFYFFNIQSFCKILAGDAA